MNFELNSLLKEILENIIETDPEFGNILTQLKEGSLSESEAMFSFSEIAARNPDIVRELNKLQKWNENHKEEVQDIVPSQEQLLNPRLYYRDQGLPQINPLAQAAIAERLQFDDDAPELRTGQILDGVKPAIAVDTLSRSPLALGQMLRDASDCIEKKIIAQKDRNFAAIEKDLAELEQKNPKGLQNIHQDEIFKIMAKNTGPEQDLPEYKRGQVPAPLAMKTNTSQLLLLSEEAKKKNYWKALATTQGRRSAVKPIESILEKTFEKKGWSVFKGDVERPQFTKTWSITLTGELDSQSNFSFIDIASGVLCNETSKFLMEECPNKDKTFLFRVDALNNYSERLVGWTIYVKEKI